MSSSPDGFLSAAGSGPHQANIKQLLILDRSVYKVWVGQEDCLVATLTCMSSLVSVCAANVQDLNAPLFALPMGLIKQPATGPDNGAANHPHIH